MRRGLIRTAIGGALVVAASAAVLVVPGFTNNAGGTTGPAPHILVNVSINDSKTVLSKRAVADVTYVDFFVHNVGKLTHNFQIGDQKTAVLRPGGRVHFFVSFPVYGYYRYKVTVHGTPGMAGRFKIDSPEAPD
jgi:plastocyanin